MSKFLVQSITTPVWVLAFGGLVLSGCSRAHADGAQRVSIAAADEVGIPYAARDGGMPRPTGDAAMPGGGMGDGGGLPRPPGNPPPPGSPAPTPNPGQPAPAPSPVAPGQPQPLPPPGTQR